MLAIQNTVEKNTVSDSIFPNEINYLGQILRAGWAILADGIFEVVTDRLKRYRQISRPNVLLE